MGDLVALLFALGMLGAPALYLVYLGRAEPGRLAKGCTPQARFETSARRVDEVAERIHAAIRAQVLARIDGEAADDATRRARVLELAADGLVVSRGVATPPGPVRVLLEIRERGDRPGMQAIVFVRRDPSAGDRFALEVRGARPRPFGVRRRESALLVETLQRALAADPNVRAVEWSSDGKRWSNAASSGSERPPG